MASSVNDMLAVANREVPKLSPQEVREKLRSGNTLLVDVRDGTEVRDNGKIRGAVNVARGMLEFRADPESPYHDPAFRKDRTVILYCASGPTLTVTRYEKWVFADVTRVYGECA